MTGVLIAFVRILAWVLNIAVFMRVLISWLPISRDNQFVVLLYEITEPILGPIRRVLPSMGGFDLSPMVGLMLISLAERVILMLLYSL